MIFKKKKNWQPSFYLSDFPDPAKAVLTLAMGAYALVHIFSLLEVYLKTRVQFTSAHEYFSYMSAVKLAATSHAHFFGHATMYALTATAFLLTRQSERAKTVFVCLALASGLLDVPSWWMIKYMGDSWEVFSMIAGVFAAVGWGYMSLRVLYELWFFKKEVG